MIGTSCTRAGRIWKFSGVFIQASFSMTRRWNWRKRSAGQRNTGILPVSSIGHLARSEKAQAEKLVRPFRLEA
jgi:hypothetical protein